MITIRAEIEHVENYLKIQEVRYGDIMEYSIEISEDIKKNYIVKMTLQPLVENALYHGLRNQRKKGKIRIYSIEDENNIFLIVEDNGIGMEPEQVDKLNEEMYNEKLCKAAWNNRSSGFGISNVNRRLKLYYGEEFGLIIESEAGVGTKMIVVVPRMEQVEE